jgi:threonylcarbamoyladenosine tRNA methylthiotransferase MtaB
MSNKNTVGIYTLGCRVNQYESCAIAELLEDRGFLLKKSGECDFYIVNTCAVTAESERKSRQLVRRCAKKGKVLVIGCASQIDNSFCDIENVIYNGGNVNKTAVVDVISGAKTAEKNSVSTMENAQYENMCLSKKDELFSECRAFIKIQDGCNGKCTYCIIPKCRGKVRSRSFEEIISEAKRLVSVGYSEIILTGIEVSAYNKVPLWELITALSDIEGLKRLRLGSLSPNIINEKFLDAVSNSKNFMPHFHLSLQSCCDKVLRDMKRPYTKKDIFDRVIALKQKVPNCMISADIICGFPGETEFDFEETEKAISELGIFHVHSFPYSERKGTVAAELPNSVPKNIRSERNAKLIDTVSKTRRAILDTFIERDVSVLIEKIVDGMAIGHTEEFLEATFEAFGCNVGDIVKINVKSHDGTFLVGTII